MNLSLSNLLSRTTVFYGVSKFFGLNECGDQFINLNFSHDI